MRMRCSTVELRARFSNSLVDPEGIEPTSHPCHGCILPVNYGPAYRLRHAASLRITRCARTRQASKLYFTRFIVVGDLGRRRWGEGLESGERGAGGEGRARCFV